MQIKKSTLKQIIQEEISKALREGDQEDPFQQKIDDDIATIADPGKQEIVRNLIRRAQEIGGEAPIDIGDIGDQEDPFQQKMNDDIATIADDDEGDLVRILVNRAREIGVDAMIEEQLPLLKDMLSHYNYTLTLVAQDVLEKLLKDLKQRQQVTPPTGDI